MTPGPGDPEVAYAEQGTTSAREPVCSCSLPRTRSRRQYTRRVRHNLSRPSSTSKGGVVCAVCAVCVCVCVREYECMCACVCVWGGGNLLPARDDDGCRVFHSAKRDMISWRGSGRYERSMPIRRRDMADRVRPYV